VKDGLRQLDDHLDERLRSMDERFVAATAPRVARVLDRIGAAARSSREAATGLVREVDLRHLSTLDDKYATSGPLALFREIPQLLGVVVGMVFIVGTLAAAHDLQSRQTADQQAVQSPDGTSTSGVPLSLALGPTVGKTATSYLTLAANSLDTAAAQSPDEQRLALVTLSAYYRPAQARTILSGYVVDRAWVRDSAAGRQAPPMPVEVSGDLGSSLATFYSRTAKGQQEASDQYQQLADTTVNDKQYRDFYEQFARLSRAQAKAFGSDCPCVFAFVVSATPTQLQSLRSRPGVRSVEVAGKGARLSDLDITTLLPEVRGVVPNPAAVVDPPS
jgi:hypothetical protein